MNYLSDFSDWKDIGPAERDEKNPVPYNLDRFPLEIKTWDKVSMNVWILGKLDPTSPPLPSYSGTRFSLSWRKSRNSIWLAFHHTGWNQENFLASHNCWSDGTWRIFKLKRKLVIYCQDTKVFEVFYKDLFDTDTQKFLQRSVKDLSKTVTHIWFAGGGTKSIKITGWFIISLRNRKIQYVNNDI
jgi:hypothetical protein